MSPRPEIDKPLTPRQAWQPFTPRGVAAFAEATPARLAIAQLIMAAVMAGAVVWFLTVAWFPVVHDAIRQLPATGRIQGSVLHFDGRSPARLAENSLLAFVVDVGSTGWAGQVADIEVTFSRAGVAVCGVLGCRRQPYPEGYSFSFNRPQLEPAWGAWRGPILAVAVVATALSMFVTWWALALVCAPVVKLIAFFADRTVTWPGAWRLSGAALLPGGLIVAMGLVSYGFGMLSLPRLGLLYALHLVVDGLFVLTSPLFLPRIAKLSGRNPFTAGILK